MTDTGSPTDAQPSDNSAEAFPARLRVHALARTLGVTSRDVLAHLHELGVVARSASSSISGEQAQSVADRLAAPAEAESAAEPELAAEPAPAAEPAGAVTESLFSAITVEEPSAAGAVAAEVSPLFLPPSAPKTAPEPEKAAAGTSKTATPETETPEAESTAPEKSEAEPVETAAEQADEAEQPEGADTAENADDTEDGQQRARRRRRGRRGRGRGRGDAAETDGAADDSAADTEAPAEETPAAEAAESAAAEAEPAADQRADEKRGDRKKGKSKKAKAAADEEQPAEGDSSETAAEDTSADDADAEGENGDGDEAATPTSKRRRRRRRRKGGAGDGEEASPDDPPNTVVHEREPRAKKVRDEVQGISGSTRLEAKRQRRRDGRDAGRRRPPILSESEFLARREAVERVMVVRERVVDPAAAAADPHAPTEDYTQVAVLEDGVLVEHFVTTETSQSMVGNIYLGRVQNVLPGMEAAFVDIGRGRNGVLYAGEVNWEAAGLDGGSRKIEQALKPGDYVLVQVSKDPVGHKGARLTTQISLAGRYLVYVPGGTSTGISRKLPDTERKRLKSILSKLVPDEAGVIIRTASEGVSAEELGADIARLETQWKGIEAAAAEHTAKASGTTRALYEEPDLLVRVVRDLFNEDFTKLVVEGEKAWDQVSGYVTSVAPDLSERVTRFEKESPTAADVFGVYRIDEQLTKALDRKVWLPSGGTLIIEHTEAMTVVDVNTGKFTGAGGNLEETVTRNNLEAAEEIVRQMRLRDIGGMIIVDFIDMVLESNRDLVLRRLTEALARDRTRHQVSEVTSLGLVQMTRKRLGTGLLEAFSTTCQTCHGRGVIVHQNPVEVRSGGETPGEGGSKRSRRNKRKSEKADAPAPVVESKAHKPAAEHPLFKAMAHHEDDETGAMVEAVDDAAAALAAEAESAFTAVAALAEGVSVEVIETVTEVVEAAEVRAEEETAVVAGLVVQTEVVEAVLAGAAAPEAEAVAAESAAQAPSAGTPSAEGGPAVVRRRRRATRRPSAPSAPAEPLVVTAETPVTTVAAQTEAPVVEVTRKPRRRTSRRAGAGSTASGPNVTASPPAQA